eukprot:scaffold2425_cov78-Cylindrotheca_fusiformis.AAC.1
MENITRRCIKILHFMENKGPQKDAKYCIRGLEGHTLHGSRYKRKIRDASIACVLEEQCRQIEEQGFLQDTVIATIYRQIASSSQQRAHVLGCRDHKVAQLLYSENEYHFRATPTKPPLRSIIKLTGVDPNSSHKSRPEIPDMRSCSLDGSLQQAKNNARAA